MAFVFAGNIQVGAALAGSLSAAGFQAAESLGEADVVVTYCTTRDSAEELYLGSEGVIASAKHGALLIDLSAATPSAAREVSALAQVSELRYVAAPLVVRDLTVADAFSDPANLAVFAAGDEGDVEHALPYLHAIAARVDRLGEVGSAQLAKCASTLMQAASLVAIAEAHSLAWSNAGDREAAEVSSSLARMGLLSPEQAGVVAALAEGAFTSTFTVEAMRCEIECAVAAADEMGLVIPQAESAQELLSLLSIVGGNDRSPAILALAYRDEDECARAGLDWSRAESTYAEHDDCDCGHDHAHGHDHVHDDFDASDDDDDDDSRDDDFAAGFVFEEDDDEWDESWLVEDDE